MTQRLLLAGVAALGLVLSAAPALAQNGNGKGEGNGRGQEARGEGRGEGRGGDRGEDRGRGRGQDQREPRGGRDDRPIVIVEDRGRPDRIERRIEEARRDTERDVRRDIERDLRRDLEDVRNVVVVRDYDRRLIQGCPPGLAKRDNGCLPPGQARQIARAVEADPWSYLWRRSGDDYRYRYDDGYLYRLNPQGGLLGYLPVLGGVLSPGNVWPTQYAYDPTPDYLSRYYGFDDRYQYRYADGVVYAVDPQTQAISQIAALLTGQPITVGQPLPSGYDIYNVPYAYRSQYVDGPDRYYRYNDGYIYQVDPTTQLVQAAIQLLT
jgi:hypothetical protein